MIKSVFLFTTPYPRILLFLFLRASAVVVSLSVSLSFPYLPRVLFESGLLREFVLLSSSPTRQIAEARDRGEGKRARTDIKAEARRDLITFHLVWLDFLSRWTWQRTVVEGGRACISGTPKKTRKSETKMARRARGWYPFLEDPLKRPFDKRGEAAMRSGRGISLRALKKRNRSRKRRAPVSNLKASSRSKEGERRIHSP